MYKRTLSETIFQTLNKGFVTVIYGARRVGKTILLDQIKEHLIDNKIISFNGDTSESIQALSTNSEIKLAQLIKNYDAIFIDEAQKIPGITLALKIIVDAFPDKKIIVTGSSSLQLSKGSSENLTGRNRPFILFPLSTREITADTKSFQAPSFLDCQLVFGGYPYVYHLAKDEEKRQYLVSIVRDYLFQDILSLERIDSPDNFKKLASLLAFQIGQEVSLNELANSLNTSVKTISRYIDLLEQSFVIFHLDAYSTNKRNEITKGKKYYFYDLGIRNALIEQFMPLSNRSDIGHLWENFLIVERMKKHEYSQKLISRYFWRNYAGREIDLIEIDNGVITAFEFKWSRASSKTPKNFRENYGVDVQIINKENYLDFI